MLEEVLILGLKPYFVTGDAWYSSLENLKFIRKHGLGMLFGIDKQRTVSVEKGNYCQIQNVENWQEDGVILYLKDFGMVKAFRQENKETYRYYIIAMPEIKMLDDVSYKDFKSIHADHWNIEEFHRAIKQLCNIEKFQIRNTNAINSHVFCSLVAFVHLEFLRIGKEISNWYQLKKQQFMEIIRDFISSHNLDAFIRLPVNA